MAKQEPKIALVHDWLTNFRGGERVLLALKEAFPNADIYTSVYNPEKLPEFDKYKNEIKTTWLQKLPKPLRNFHQLFPVIRVFAFRSLKLKEYDIIISDTSSDAKQVKGGKNTRHISYCFTPTRYYWSHYDDYKKDPGFGKLSLIIKPFIPPFVWLMRKFDYSAAQKVTEFVAISTEIQKRIQKYYKRESIVIFPPADTHLIKFNKDIKNRAGYVLLGAQVAYKRPDLAIQACIKLNLELTVIGNGSEHEKLKELSKNHPNIKFRVDVSDQEKSDLLGTFKAQIFPQEEDYGITAIECMAAGTPVIAVKKGGALDFISPESGAFFIEQTVESLIKTLQKVESGKLKFKPEEVRAQAENFSKEKFVSKIWKLVQQQD
jgi:glycosyltransferase involved in cell wall biosynthesis